MAHVQMNHPLRHRCKPIGNPLIRHIIRPCCRASVCSNLGQTREGRETRSAPLNTRHPGPYARAIVCHPPAYRPIGETHLRNRAVTTDMVETFTCGRAGGGGVVLLPLTMESRRDTSSTGRFGGQARRYGYKSSIYHCFPWRYYFLNDPPPPSAFPRRESGGVG